MAIQQPYRRTCRPFIDNLYSQGGRSAYLRHPKFSLDPTHYIRAFLLIQRDLQELFAYVEPVDENSATYSHRIQQLLMRTCVEVEANLTAIMRENGYTKNHMTMCDYRKVDASHRLSSFEVLIPVWHGAKSTRRPFASWRDKGSLAWYQAYNRSKHDRHGAFREATLDALIDSVAALAVVLAAQFHTEEFSAVDQLLSVGSAFSYGRPPDTETAIGDYFLLRFPSDWPLDERYDFDWRELNSIADPFVHFDYSAID